MVKKVLYECCVCHRDYEKEQDALVCEKTHCPCEVISKAI